jgi:hypothetical protein
MTISQRHDVLRDDHPVLRICPGSVAWRLVDGEVMLLDLGTSEYHALNRVASVLWVNLEHGTTIGDLVGIIGDQFEVVADIAERDVRAFVDRCVARGWIER